MPRAGGPLVSGRMGKLGDPGVNFTAQDTGAVVVIAGAITARPLTANEVVYGDANGTPITSTLDTDQSGGAAVFSVSFDNSEGAPLGTGTLAVIGNFSASAAFVGTGAGSAALPVHAISNGAAAYHGHYRKAASQMGVGVVGLEAGWWELSANRARMNVVADDPGSPEEVIYMGHVSGGLSGIGWVQDSDTFIERSAANTLIIQAGGVNTTFTASAATFAAPVVVPAGAATAPSLAFSGNLNTGIYQFAANRVGVAANGAAVAVMDANGHNVIVGQVVAPVGAVGAPSYVFSGDGDTGIYRVGADAFGIAAGGLLVAQFSAVSSARRIGFYNTTPAIQQTPTGSRGGNAALASLLTALATIGLIVDGTSA